MDISGKRRIVITNIIPQVENGAYPAKAVLDEIVPISADIFCDGHDMPGASVLLKHQKERQWKEHPMLPLGNDRWVYEFSPGKTGFYQFQIMGWVAHFATWRRDLEKRIAAGEEVGIDLLVGAELMEQAGERAAAADRQKLLRWAAQLKQTPDPRGILRLLNSAEVNAVVSRSRDASLRTVSAGSYEIEVEGRKAGFSTWYELFPRSAGSEQAKHGTFRDVEKLLPRVARMGFDVLYLPPIHPIGETKRKGRNNALTTTTDDPGSPWAVGSRLGGHKAIHPELGTLDDFRSLVEKAKQHDIDIALDIAFQCAPDHPYVREHPQWFKWRPDGTVQYAENPPKKYEDILPFNFECDDWQSLWNELKSIVEYWIGQGVVIFRIDNPHTKPFAFWEWMIKSVRKKHPQVLFLAEAFTRPRIMERLAKLGFNQSYTYFTWRNSKKELEQYMKELTRTDMRYYFRPNFWPNTPDILPAELVAGGENAHIMRLILAATLSSNYGLYGPVYEFGISTPYPGKEEYTDNEKYEIKHWAWDRYTRIGEIISRINRIRKENPALQTTWNIHFAETDNENLICYVKRCRRTGNRLIIAVNLDSHNTQSGYVKIPLEKLEIGAGQRYAIKDLLSGDKYHWQDEWNYIKLNPYQMPAHIFRIEQQDKA